MSATPLAVVMPVYNEAGVIREVVAGVTAKVLDAVPSARLVLVDDRGTDGTSSILAELADADERVTLLTNPANLGHGPSLRNGLDHTDSDWVLLLDSDGQVDVADFATMWDRRHDADLVIGVRVARDDPRHRLVSSMAANLLVSALLRRRVRDSNVGFKLVRRSLYEHLRPTIPPGAFAPSILLVMGTLRAGARLVEIPVAHRARPAGPSTLKAGRLARALGLSAAQAIAHRARPVAPFPARPGG